MSGSTRSSELESRRAVSISRAAEILGVNQATLRQWSDEGKVKGFTTPGGHRRFFEDELVSLTETRSMAAPRPALAQLLLSTYERYESVVRRCATGSEWFQNFDAAARRRFRILGRSMLSLVSAYLTGSRRERTRTLAEGREVAAEYGVEAARLGLSLSEATEAFLLFRRPILESLQRWLGDCQPARREADALVRHANQFMDEVLLSMASAHEAYCSGQSVGTR